MKLPLTNQAMFDYL